MGRGRWHAPDPVGEIKPEDAVRRGVVWLDCNPKGCSRGKRASSIRVVSVLRG
jgi:hypothetical protein